MALMPEGVGLTTADAVRGVSLEITPPYTSISVGGTSTLGFTASGTVQEFVVAPLSGSSTLTFTPTGTVVGTGVVAGSSTLTFTPTAAVGPRPMLDGLSGQAFSALFCCAARLLSTYGGSLFRVRRASDNAEQDIGFHAVTLLPDTVSLASFCAGTNGFVSKFYDQSGNSRDLTPATTGVQPKIYDSATGALTLNGYLSPVYDATDDRAIRGDACGLTGASAVTLWSVWTTARTTGFPFAGAVGNSGFTNGHAFTMFMNNGVTALRVSVQGADRTFTSSDLSAGTNNTIARLAAGAGIGTCKVRRNGTELTESGVNSGTNTLNFDTSLTTIVGAVSSNHLNGRNVIWGVASVEFTDPNTAILDACSTYYFAT